MAYAVNVTRDGEWWMMAVPAIDGLTQARRLSDVERMARELVAVETGADLADVAVAVRVTVAPAEPAKLSPEDQDVLLTYLQDQVAKANVRKLRINPDGRGVQQCCKLPLRRRKLWRAALYGPTAERCDCKMGVSLLALWREGCGVGPSCGQLWPTCAPFADRDAPKYGVRHGQCRPILAVRELFAHGGTVRLWNGSTFRLHYASSPGMSARIRAASSGSLTSWPTSRRRTEVAGTLVRPSS